MNRKDDNSLSSSAVSLRLTKKHMSYPKRLKYKSIIVMKSKLNNDIPLLSCTSKAKFQCTKICRATNGPPATKGPTIIMKSNSAHIFTQLVNIG